MSVNGLLRNVQGIANTTRGATQVLTRLEGGSFWAQLKPASYRGVPFATLAGSVSFGRRNAVHEYPFRDMPWVEDLGRQARRFQVTGFLIGDDVIAQRDLLVRKVEEAGDGELVHPTLGKRRVALMGFVSQERWEQGRYFEISFSFIEQGQRLFPQQLVNGQTQVQQQAEQTHLDAARAFVRRTADVLQTYASAADEIAQQVSDYAGEAEALMRDATSLVNLAATLPGEYGRLLGQASGIKAGQVVPKVVGILPEDLKGIAAAQRTAVAAAAEAARAAGAALGSTGSDLVAAQAQALAKAVRANAPTAGDAVRSLAAMAGFESGSASAGAAAIAQDEAVLMVQRAAVAELASAMAEYQPSSSDDAAQVRRLVLAAVDAQITSAGDRGDDAVYQQLRNLRAAAVADINARGGALPDLVPVNSPMSVPALVLAHRLYGDIGRTAELVQRADPIHPAFMPLTFKALSA